MNSEINIHSYKFTQYNDVCQLAGLGDLKKFPSIAYNFFYEKDFNYHLGKYLSEQKILDENNPEFSNDIKLIAEYCSIYQHRGQFNATERKNRSVDFIINTKAVHAKSPSTMTRFQEGALKIAKLTVYENKADLPEYIITT